MNRIISAINLFLGVAVIALVIAYAAIIIPIALATVAGFCLILWLFAHLADGAFYVYRRIKRWSFWGR